MFGRLPVALLRPFGCFFHRFDTCASSLLCRFRFGIKLVFGVTCVHREGERNNQGYQGNESFQVALLHRRFPAILT